MKNTKFRRRALVSSIAMLLVALVALGSATFAWFSTTNSATASSMTAKTAAASNVLLNDAPATKEWTNNLTFSAGTSTNTDNMVPVTTKNFTDWYSVQAANLDDGYSATAYSSDNKVATPKSASGYVKYAPLYIKSAGETKTLKITPTVTANEQSKSYLRVALVPIATGGDDTNVTADFSSASSEAGATAIIFAATDNDRSNATTGWTADSQTKDSIVTSQNWATVTLGSAVADKVYGFDVYVYYEGTDFDCKDSKSGTSATVTFSVTV